MGPGSIGERTGWLCIAADGAVKACGGVERNSGPLGEHLFAQDLCSHDFDGLLGEERERRADSDVGDLVVAHGAQLLHRGALNGLQAVWGESEMFFWVEFHVDVNVIKGFADRLDLRLISLGQNPLMKVACLDLLEKLCGCHWCRKRRERVYL
ncbi:hypothetical protein OGATHE_005661 [Ogataea polymorpha]|uniref:Uncharacterized protein n=1 Tax=Ogataea polymorpha TaxID=460523 RepID=A0A9P8SZK3_9ASCO|nr:hypothetical protein OGATHE_005661 [Ogataea polymorpha]